MDHHFLNLPFLQDPFIVESWIFFEFLYGKNDFVERSKILLYTDLKIILLGHQNNFVRTLKIMSNAAKNFDTLATSLSVHNYFDSSTKLLF